MAKSKKYKYTTSEPRPASGVSDNPESAWCRPNTSTNENGAIRYIFFVNTENNDNDTIESSNDDDTDTKVKYKNYVPYTFCGKCDKWLSPFERPHTTKDHTRFKLKLNLNATMDKNHPAAFHISKWKKSKNGFRPAKNSKIIKAEAAAKGKSTNRRSKSTGKKAPSTKSTATGKLSKAKSTEQVSKSTGKKATSTNPTASLGNAKPTKQGSRSSGKKATTTKKSTALVEVETEQVTKPTGKKATLTNSGIHGLGEAVIADV